MVRLFCHESIKRLIDTSVCRSSWPFYEKQNTYFQLWRENLNSKKSERSHCEVDDKIVKVNDISVKVNDIIVEFNNIVEK